MNATEIIQKILKNKGQFRNASWERDCQVKKDSPPIRKRTEMENVRIGLEYDNMGIVHEKRESGELPSVNTGLPNWCEWKQYPYIAKNKFNGTEYVRVYPRSSSYKKYTYLINGVEKTKEEVSDYLGSIEKKESKDICKWVKLNDILNIK